MKPKRHRPANALIAACAITVVSMTACGATQQPALNPPPATATREEKDVAARLERHVRVLAKDIGERHVIDPRKTELVENLRKASAYIKAELTALGYAPRAQAFPTNGEEVENWDVELRGVSNPEELVVVGAHYDSAEGTPGADDNASGTAAVLELARLLKGKSPARTIHLALFVNEEEPFFHTGRMGSLFYAKRMKARHRNVVAMLSLEMLGFYDDRKGSQHYPWPLSIFYPDTGDFIGFVGNVDSRGLVKKVNASFRTHAKVPSVEASIPGFIPGADWSDHWSFWKQGYEAVMVTDTALFRNIHYHTAGDTPEIIDYRRMAQVTLGLAGVVGDLATN